MDHTYSAIPRSFVLWHTICVFVPLAMVAAVLVYLFIRAEHAVSRSVMESAASKAVDLAAQRIQTVHHAVGEDIRLLVDLPSLWEWLTEGSDTALAEVEKRFLVFSQHRLVYAQLRFIDASGRERIRVDRGADGKAHLIAASDLQDKSERYYVAGTLSLEHGQIYVSDFDLNIEYGAIEQPLNPMLRVGSPVVDRQGRKHGLVLINYRGQALLNQLRAIDGGLAQETWHVSKRGDRNTQLWLVNGQGYWLIGPSVEDEWGFMIPNRAYRNISHAFPDAWATIRAGAPRGQFVSHGDLFTFARVLLGQRGTASEVSGAGTPPALIVMTFVPETAFNRYLASLMEPMRPLLLALVVLLLGVAWIVARQMAAREVAKRDIEALNVRLRRDNAALNAVNKELEAFSYSVSHDLRSPLRAIDGFSQALLEDFGDTLPDEGKDYLSRVRRATQRMGSLIDDLLVLARVTRSDLHLETVDLSAMATDIVASLREREAAREVAVDIDPGITMQGDVRLMRLALENLFDNAWKFTSKQDMPRIVFRRMAPNGANVFFIKDNGAGFNMAYADKLFGAFQRLHDQGQFPGSGIGLATVQRVVTKHGGKIWAESEPGKGATFFLEF